ncbi:hypothetical protein HanIR_Chr13g0640961 [Helianthus annuus]|nr:hypothetical protein HanIR_Chr13g0640961 [Helianthus annuus]
MSLLHHLWDDTFAGPPPEKGQTTSTFRSSESGKGELPPVKNLAAGDPPTKVTPVTSLLLSSVGLEPKTSGRLKALPLPMDHTPFAHSFIYHHRAVFENAKNILGPERDKKIGPYPPYNNILFNFSK